MTIFLIIFNIEKYIINVFNENNLPITFGVVPGGGHLNNNAIDILKKADKKNEVEIAMHGFAHTDKELFGTYDEQYKLLQKGKKILENSFNVHVETFIPPYNRYSINTIKVLESLNFKAISGDIDGPFVNNSKIIFLPAASKLNSLRKDIASVRNLKLDRCIIIVLLHHYDFIDDNTKGLISKKDFAELIKWISVQSDIDVKTIGQVSNLIDGKYFVNYNKISALSLAQFLPFDQHKFVLHFYPSFTLAKSLKNKLYTFLIIYNIILLILFLTASYFIFYKFFAKRIRMTYFIFILLSFFLLFIFPYRFWGTFSVLVLGIIGGILLSNYRLKVLPK